jgi:hypothetical protein
MRRPVHLLFSGNVFNERVVLEIAREACPRWEILGDASRIASKMNDAADTLFAVLVGNQPPNAAEARAKKLGRAAGAFLKVIGSRPSVTARSIRFIDLEQFDTMVDIVQDVALTARRSADRASKREDGRDRSQAAYDWLASMETIYADLFSRKPGTVTSPTRGSTRSGPAPRFIAMAARRIALSPTASRGNRRWTKAMTHLSHPETIAEMIRYRRRRDKRELPGSKKSKSPFRRKPKDTRYRKPP